MIKKTRTQEEAQDEVEELKSRLAETEETLRAIQQYMVDAFVVNRENGIHVVTWMHLWSIARTAFMW